MNERAIKLYEQATEFAYETIGKEHANTSYFQGTIAGKFAELIVKECIQVSEAHAKNLESQCQSTDSYLEAYEDGIVNGIYEATETIKQHFGVE